MTCEELFSIIAMTELCSRCYSLISLGWVDDDNSIVDLDFGDKQSKIFEAGFYDGMRLRVKVNETIEDISALPIFNWETPFNFGEPIGKLSPSDAFKSNGFEWKSDDINNIKSSIMPSNMFVVTNGAVRKLGFVDFEENDYLYKQD